MIRILPNNYGFRVSPLEIVKMHLMNNEGFQLHTENRARKMMKVTKVVMLKEVNVAAVGFKHEI